MFPAIKPSESDFHRTEQAFASAVRGEEGCCPETVPRERLELYRELVFNNINEFLSNAFPVLRRITDESLWQHRARSFLREHRSQTPLFNRIAEEFVGYLQHHYQPVAGDPPFLAELAHYEWVELALNLDEAQPETIAVERHGDLYRGIPVVSPTAWLLHYRWPVHEIGPDHLPVEPSEQPHHLLVYRDLEDRIGFLELNPVTARLLQLLQEEAVSGEQALQRIADELGHPNPAAVIDGGMQQLQELQRREVILGTLPTTVEN